jgi:tetratricopeptide (TPR) repeat protein
VLVFSFSEGDPDEFFGELASFLADGSSTQSPTDPSRSYHWILQLLRGNAATAEGRRLLLLIDGLERVQDDGSRGGKFGQLVDGRLRDLVLRVADGWVPGVSMIITSRFRLFDPLAQRSLHYHQIEIKRLEATAAIALLRVRGARGTDNELDSIARAQQYHALSLDLIGGYLGLFCDGDPNQLPPAPSVSEEDPDEDPGIAALREQGSKFLAIAQWYRTALAGRDPAALAIVERVCLFRLGVDAAVFAAIFTGEGKTKISGIELAALGEPDVEQKLKTLAQWRLMEVEDQDAPATAGERPARKTRYQVHPAVRVGFLKGLDATTVRLGHEATMTELQKVLSGQPQSEDRPNAETFDLLEEIIHHAIRAGELNAAIELYHGRIGGYWRLGQRAHPGDLERGRRICEALAGPMVFPSVNLPDGVPYPALTRTLADWASYSLALGRLEEAVRIREIQTSHPPASVGRQDFGPPTRLAEAYAYAAEALLLEGRVPAAIKNLEKGYQIAHGVGDPSSGKKVYGFLAHAHGLLGEVEEAARYFEDSRYLQNLGEYEYPLARPGEFDDQPLYSLGGVLLNLYQIRCGLFDDAENNAVFNYRTMASANPRSAILPAIRLIWATLASKRSAWDDAYASCRTAFDWAVARDANETLCWSALTRTRIILDELELAARSEDSGSTGPKVEESLAAALTGLQEGIFIARQCGYGIYHIDLMLESSRLRLWSGDPHSALQDIRVALDEGVRPPTGSGRPVLVAANSPDCGYAWGIAEGRHRRAEALLLEASQMLGKREVESPADKTLPSEVRKRIEMARKDLEECKSSRLRIQDPKVRETERVIRELERGVLTAYPLRSIYNTPQGQQPGLGGEAGAPNEPFDVFLSHHSNDKPAARQLADALRSRGLTVWMDEAELVPGRAWQEAIEEAIQIAKSAVVLVGANGLGPWETVEMRLCFSEFVHRGLPVIPVIFSGAPMEALPPFLRQLTWVDLREGLTREGLDRLEHGITGRA